jgi:hypothetical protein
MMLTVHARLECIARPRPDVIGRPGNYEVPGMQFPNSVAAKVKKSQQRASSGRFGTVATFLCIIRLVHRDH